MSTRQTADRFRMSSELADHVLNNELGFPKVTDTWDLLTSEQKYTRFTKSMNNLELFRADVDNFHVGFITRAIKCSISQLSAGNKGACNISVTEGDLQPGR